jgi:LysR family glycine cleavage system transcriptional activator
MNARSNVSLRGLRTFCAAAEHESFSAAGETLFITPSAVSHQIKSLEEELGHRLFDRNARDLKLTATGKALFNDIAPVIRELDRIVAALREDVEKTSIRMSVQPFFASEYFVPRLGEFTENNPDIDIRVAASDESAETVPGDADLSIRLHRKPPRGVESRLLMPLRLAPAGSKSFKSSLRVKDGAIVSQFPLIIHESFPKAWQQWAMKSGVALPEDAKVTRLDSMIAVVRATEQGIGAALVPVPIASQWFEQETIVRLFDEDLIADQSYYLVWEKGVAEKNGVDRLLDWIHKRFAATA